MNKNVVEISVDNAKKAYSKADKEGKDMLLNLIGSNILGLSIIDRVQCFEDALAIDGEQDPNVKILLSYNGINKDLLAAQAQMKLTIGIRVLHEGRELDYNNSSQRKYEPVFNIAGSGFSCAHYDRWYTFSCAGSRLAYESTELLYHGVKIFLPEYKALFKK